LPTWVAETASPEQTDLPEEVHGGVKPSVDGDQELA